MSCAGLGPRPTPAACLCLAPAKRLREKPLGCMRLKPADTLDLAQVLQGVLMSRDGPVRYAAAERHPLMMVAIAFACLVAVRAFAVVWLHSLLRRWIEPPLMDSDIAAEEACGASRPSVAAVPGYSDSKAVREKPARTDGRTRSGHGRLPRRCDY